MEATRPTVRARAKKNGVLFEFHSILVVMSTEETKSNIVELKVRIAMAEDMHGTQFQEMQREPALLEVIDLISHYEATYRDNQRCGLEHVLHRGRKLRQQCPHWMRSYDDS